MKGIGLVKGKKGALLVVSSCSTLFPVRLPVHKGMVSCHAGETDQSMPEEGVLFAGIHRS